MSASPCEPPPCSSGGCTLVEECVRRLWRGKPGIGLKETMAAVSLEFPELVSAPGTRGADGQSANLLKRRVKAATAALPYVRTTDLPQAATTSTQRAEVVQALVDRRQTHRAAREWSASARMLDGLVAMGIRVDDGLKQWRVGPAPPQEEEGEGGTKDCQSAGVQAAAGGSAITCSSCGQPFPSRTLLFAHLRSPSTSCGLAIFAAGETIDVPPSALAAQERKRTNGEPDHTTSNKLAIFARHVRA